MNRMGRSFGRKLRGEYRIQGTYLALGDRTNVSGVWLKD